MSKIIVTPLGTISPYPKDNHNCPSYLIEYKNHFILLDCGNGCTRFLKFPEKLNNLSVIITHYHKDHFGDIGALQYASFVYHNLGLLPNKINVYFPKQDFGNNKESIISNEESYANYIEVSDGYSFKIDDLEITLHDNRSHSIESFIVKLKNSKYKIVYTSDIGITNFDDLVSFSSNANLLISESSFIEGHNSSSLTHLKASDAAKLAKLSNAYLLLLTHLWPEEDRLNYLNEAREIFFNTEIAEENKSLILRSE